MWRPGGGIGGGGGEAVILPYPGGEISPYPGGTIPPYPGGSTKSGTHKEETRSFTLKAPNYNIQPSISQWSQRYSRWRSSARETVRGCVRLVLEARQVRLLRT